MPTHDKFKARKLAVAREILTPAFPEDVEHLVDGSWSCSGASFKAMSRSFRRFGFTLDYSWSFDTLYEKFAFILEAACRVPGAGSGAQHDYSPAMLDYLLAVKSRDDSLIALTLDAVLAQDRPAEPPGERLPCSAPKLCLVQ